MAKDVCTWGLALAALWCSFEAKAIEVECYFDSPMPHEVGDLLGRCSMSWGYWDEILYTWGGFAATYQDLRHRLSRRPSEVRSVPTRVCR